MARTLTQVKIDSIDVTNYLVEYVFEKTFGDAVHTIDMTFAKSVDEVLILSAGQRLEIWRGWTTATDEKIFDGFVEKFVFEIGKTKIVGKDKMAQLITREVTHTYFDTDPQAGKISDIFKDLVTTYGGLNADAGSIQDSGGAYLITKYVCNHADVFERCKRLAEALDWQFYYRADTDKVYFEPKGFGTNSNVLEVGGLTQNIVEMPKWSEDNTEMINWLTVIGANQLVETTQFFNGTGALFTFTLTEVPVSIKVYLGGTLQKGGLEDVTTNPNYTVDSKAKTITFVVVPPIGTNNIEVRYSYSVPIPIELVDPASQTNYGIYRKTIFFQDLKNVADAEVRGQNILTTYASPFQYTSLKIQNIDASEILLGQRIRVVDRFNDIDDYFTINRFIMKYPTNYDDLYVGDKYWRSAEWQSNVEERLHRLEEQNFENQDKLLQLRTFEPDFTIQPRYFTTTVQSIAGNVLIWGNPSFGTWNVYYWGSNALQSFILGHAQAGILGP